jgi:hypothetical protein
MYITGDLAMQFMATGRESMAGHWCLQCMASKVQFLDEMRLWTMDDLNKLGEKAENRRKEEQPQLGIKQRPWWPFIPLSHYMVPLLHCEIGIGNQLLDKLRDCINEHIEKMAPTEMETRLSIPILKQIIADTATYRDEWDASADGKKMKSLLRSTNLHRKLHMGGGNEKAAESEDVQDETICITHMQDINELKCLQEFRKKTYVDKLQKARFTLGEQQLKLRAARSVKVRSQDSIETKMLKVLKSIGVELTSYHGGSLNGKDIIKLMNNATFVFDNFALIFKEGKRPDCLLTDEQIDDMCMYFREVFVLWDGAFSLARTVNPTEQEILTYREYVNSAVQGHIELRCSITPKVHLMCMHVEDQMKNIEGGLGDKMEDWVERLHQTGMRLRQRFRTVQNPLVRAVAREKAHSRNVHPEVIAHIELTNEGNKRNLTQKKIDNIATQRKIQRDVGRLAALHFFHEQRKKKENVLTWSAVVFDDARGVGGNNN